MAIMDWNQCQSELLDALENNKHELVRNLCAEIDETQNILGNKMLPGIFERACRSPDATIETITLFWDLIQNKFPDKSILFSPALIVAYQAHHPRPEVIQFLLTKTPQIISIEHPLYKTIFDGFSLALSSGNTKQIHTMWDRLGSLFDQGTLVTIQTLLRENLPALNRIVAEKPVAPSERLTAVASHSAQKITTPPITEAPEQVHPRTLKSK